MDDTEKLPRHQTLATKVITSNGKRIVQISLDAENLPDGSVEYWYQLDYMYRGALNEEFKQKIVRSRQDEMIRIIQIAGEMWQHIIPD